MLIALGALIGNGVSAHNDDFVMYAKTLKEDERLCNEVMNRPREASLKLGQKKKQIAKT